MLPINHGVCIICFHTLGRYWSLKNCFSWVRNHKTLLKNTNFFASCSWSQTTALAHDCPWPASQLEDAQGTVRPDLSGCVVYKVKAMASSIYLWYVMFQNNTVPLKNYASVFLHQSLKLPPQKQKHHNLMQSPTSKNVKSRPQANLWIGTCCGPSESFPSRAPSRQHVLVQKDLCTALQPVSPFPEVNLPICQYALNNAILSTSTEYWSDDTLLVNDQRLFSHERKTSLNGCQPGLGAWDWGSFLFLDSWSSNQRPLQL